MGKVRGRTDNRNRHEQSRDHLPDVAGPERDDTRQVLSLDDLPPGNLLTDVDVAELLRVAVATLRNQRSRGGGPKFVRLGRSRMVRYKVADVRGYIRDTGEVA